MNNNDRFHNFEIITYVEEKILLAMIENNTNVNNYAYSWHDKDIHPKGTMRNGVDIGGTLKEPHFHLLVNLKNASTLTACLNKFTIPGVNSRIIPCLNKVERYEYLWHLNNPEEYQYSKDIVHTNNENFWLNCSTASNEKTISLLEDLIQKKTFRYMVETYGRDFVINYEKYSKASQLLAFEEKEDFLCDTRTGEVQATLIESIEQDIVFSKISLNSTKK